MVKGLSIDIDGGNSLSNRSKAVRAHKVDGPYLKRQIYYKRIKNPTDRHRLTTKPSLRRIKPSLHDGRILADKLIYQANLSSLGLKKKHKRKRRNKMVVQEQAQERANQLSSPQDSMKMDSMPKMVFDNPELMSQFPELVKQGSFIENKLQKIQLAKQGPDPVQREIKKLDGFKKDINNADQINKYFKPVAKKAEPVRRLIGESSIAFKRRQKKGKRKTLDSIGGFIPIKKKQVVDRAAKNFISNYTRNTKSTAKELKGLKKDMRSMVKSQKQMQKLLNKILKKRRII
jgi:hypothetical protein